MKFKFKIQDYQTRAVNAVIDCFKGQPLATQTTYFESKADSQHAQGQQTTFEPSLFKNASLVLDEDQILENIKAVQIKEKLLQSPELETTPSCNINLDVEMETGTGKTYCYIKTIFEMNQKFGWTKFIIVVPSIAIREGVHKSLNDTVDHFQETYGEKATFFIYDSKDPNRIQSFASNTNINVMIINIQAFNTNATATGKNARRIYAELDSFGSDVPMDKIKSTQPILILDEPQRMKAKKTQAALAEFNPLFVLHYSATHSIKHNMVHRLTANDAFKQKLVKKIAVCGVSVSGLPATDGYLYLQSIQTSASNPVARIEIEIKQKNKIIRKVRNLEKGDNLYDKSGGLEEYKDLIISDIDAGAQTVLLSNGDVLQKGHATKDFGESHLRRIQIRETVRVHLEREQKLYKKRIKVLSLFFIDSVAKYRVYTDTGEENGEYATMFEEEYQDAVDRIMDDMSVSDDYKKYLEEITPARTHDGYFSMDNKNRMIDPDNPNGESKDISAYDLILKKKELLLSFKKGVKPVRFIFSHSALREGWDNPNIFVICTLKKGNAGIASRQEVGRGMRICVNENGERQDDEATVHNTNVLTVVAGESYKNFAAALQKDIFGADANKPRLAKVDYFKGVTIQTDTGAVKVTEDMATQIVHYLIRGEYVGYDHKITQEYLDAEDNETREPLPADLQPYQEQIFELIKSVYTDVKLPEIENERNTRENRLNKNFDKPEFQELWQRINHIAAWTMHFNSPELIKKCIPELNKVSVAPLEHTVQYGEQTEEGFKMKEQMAPEKVANTGSFVKGYDLLGKIADGTDLTRQTVFDILSGIDKGVFAQFKTNPEMFIVKIIDAIKDYKATNFIEHLRYDTVNKTYDIDIFEDGQHKQNFKKATEKLNRHIYDYAIIDSKPEREFAARLDINPSVSVYAKLPRGFTIPTPFGSYNPDWAIAFEEGSVKHVYFVAETKSTDDELKLRGDENKKIECAKKFFKAINKEIAPKRVKYDVVTDITSLLRIAGEKTTPTHTKNT